MAEKVDFAYKHFEQPIPIDAVLRKDEMIDTIAITRGRGTEGVVTRWGVTRLPRKTHRGLRKVISLAISASAGPDMSRRICCCIGHVYCTQSCRGVEEPVIAEMNH